MSHLFSNNPSIIYWLPHLAEFLRNELHAEAIRIDSEKRVVEVAALGSVDLNQLELALKQTLIHIAECTDCSKNTASIDDLKQHWDVLEEGHVITIRKPTCQTAPRFWHWRDVPWPETKKVGCCSHEHDWKILAGLACACGLSGLLAYLMEVFVIGPGWMPSVFYILSFIFGGWDAFQDIVKKIPKGEFDIHFLMLMVAIGASLIGAWREGALLLWLFSTSGAMEAFAFYKTRKGIDALFKKAPKVALKFINQEEVEVNVSDLIVGDYIRVKPGELFPVDGVIDVGETETDESNLTGESLPIKKIVGDIVYSGTLNMWGSVQVLVTKKANESAFQKIIRLIQEAQHLKAPSQRFTEKFGTHYTFFILGGVVVMFFICYWGLGMDPFINQPGSYSAFYRAMTLLVVASPCALVLSIPSAILAGIAWGAMRGILFRGGAAIEQMAQINCMALDKTGTLTRGELSVSAVESFPPGYEEDILHIAYSLENHTTHPIARGIVKEGRRKKLQPLEVKKFKNLVGMGVEGYINDQLVVLGKRELLSLGSLKNWQEKLPQLSMDYVEVWVITEKILGRILLKDEIREASKPVLQSLKALSIETIMLTGDHARVAEEVGQHLGIGKVLSGLKPEDKLKAIQNLKSEGKTVAMVGDGINDAPCLAVADVAIAMGARGSDAALEQSEVVLMNDKIELVLLAYRLSRYARTIIRQNLAISIITIICMIFSSIIGILPLSIGVLAHEGSTFLVCLNSLRILFLKTNFLDVK